MSKRKKAEAIILDWLSDIDPSGRNTENTKSMFKDMSDEQFHIYMEHIRDGKDFVSAVYEVLAKSAITTKNNLEVAEKRGVKIFERVWMTNAHTGRTYLSPIPYPVLLLPVRRQIQLLVNKISIPENNKHVDDLTNQPTGASKGSSLSQPESLVLLDEGHTAPLMEFLKYRGGDEKGYNLMERTIRETGDVNMDNLMQFPTVVKSTQTLSTLLKYGMFLENNLADKI